ncbi:hypothetical protein [Paenibacillus donghaensis]|uniref:hypothetical protein n=1 Tax=Paenibacillus donghaensis TaxID=414771 RepID=UPI0012FB771C|nr:hypothetical protein [Paenibacillus donghaensis]
MKKVKMIFSWSVLKVRDWNNEHPKLMKALHFLLRKITDTSIEELVTWLIEFILNSIG